MYVIKRVIVIPGLFSLVGAIILFFYGWANSQRAFVQWESLGKPPSKAIKVVSLNYVQTASGDIYQYSDPYKQGCNSLCWVKSGDPPLDSLPPDGVAWLPVDSCGDLPNLDKFVDSKTFCEDRGLAGISLTIEAIDSNGFVYSWHYSFDGEWDGIELFILPIIGAVAGLLIGLIILPVILFWELLKSAQQSDVSE